MISGNIYFVYDNNVVEVRYQIIIFTSFFILFQTACIDYNEAV